MVKVKVCGITNLGDALASIAFGADALGFNFYSASPRYVTPPQARAIVAELPDAVCKVAVFVNEPRTRVDEILGACLLPGKEQPFDGLQFHGDESQEYCKGWELKVVKAFRLKDRESVTAIEGFPADYYLLDSWNPGYGGSGVSFPWSWLDGLSREKLILAGGLDLENVAEAVRQVRPHGIDVCTGVEAKPGVKDHRRLKEFIDAAKAA